MYSVLHEFLARYPGAALEVSEDGTVLTSNKLLDASLGRELEQTVLAQALDSSSQAKWQHLLTNRDQVKTYELAFEAADSLEVRRFIAIWSLQEPTLWLIEHPRDPRMEELYLELSALNSELSTTQRAIARERSRLARALEQAEIAVRTRDEVLAIVSHDLRNPMNTIRMAAGLMQIDIPEKQKEQQVEAIIRSVDRMTTLISDLLDVSAIEAGRFQIETSPVSINVVLKEVCALSEVQAAHKQQTLRCETDGEIPPFMGDPNRLVQALMNLVGNAIKFTQQRGAIDVRARRVDDRLQIAVTDDGPGIPENDVAHVFEKYWHATRTQRGGTGLGLAITKGIVDAHGGKIWVQPKREIGTQICFELPLSAVQNTSVQG